MRFLQESIDYANDLKLETGGGGGPRPMDVDALQAEVAELKERIDEAQSGSGASSYDDQSWGDEEWECPEAGIDYMEMWKRRQTRRRGTK